MSRNWRLPPGIFGKGDLSGSNAMKVMFTCQKRNPPVEKEYVGYRLEIITVWPKKIAEKYPHWAWGCF
jgi:hypothetical protein